MTAASLLLPPIAAGLVELAILLQTALMWKAGVAPPHFWAAYLLVALAGLAWYVFARMYVPGGRARLWHLLAVINALAAAATAWILAP